MTQKQDAREVSSLPLVNTLTFLVESLIGDYVFAFFGMLGRDQWSRSSQLQITVILLAGPIVSWAIAKVLNIAVWK
jgi:hypothetical protein